MQLAQTYRSEGGVIGDMVTSTEILKNQLMLPKNMQYMKIKTLNAIYVIRAVIIARIVPFLSKQKDIY